MPISYTFFIKMDVVVTSAGCCDTAYFQGLIVISIDGRDCLPIGVYHHTTLHSLFRVDEPIIDISKLLDQVLIEHKYQKDLQPFKPMEVRFPEHDDFLRKIIISSYYPIEHIRIGFRNRVVLLAKRSLYFILGQKLYKRMSVFKSK